MWVYTTIGFFSVVQKQTDRKSGMVTVRARVRADLEALRKRLPGASLIKEDRAADYQFRVTCKRAAFADLMKRLANEIDYPNFKNAIRAVQGHERASLYHSVWDATYELRFLPVSK